MRRNVLFLAALMLVNLLLVWGQEAVVDWKWTHELLSVFDMDARYFLGGFILLLPVVPWLVLRVPHGKKVLVAGLAALCISAVAYLVKAQMPGSNRHAKMSACDWAVETIRADYQGPKTDAEPLFSCFDYHRNFRPVVAAHTVRVAYLLGGRQSNLLAGWLRDIPDYIVDEPNKAKDSDWWGAANYELLAEKKFGKREYVIYKRKGVEIKCSDKVE